MVTQEPLTARVIRVTRPDTLMVRTNVESLPAQLTLYCVLAGVKCRRAAKQRIIDWVEIHADHGRLRLVTDWLRDPYGRALVDLADLQSGETLTGWLVEQQVASPWDTHYLDTFRELMTSDEPDSCW